MKKSGLCLVFLIALALGVSLVPFKRGTVVGFSTPTKQVDMPGGQWTFSAQPYMGKGFQSRPAVVTSVKSEIKTFSVTSIGIVNNSSKSISALKLSWTLSREESPESILQQGETPLITLENPIATKASKRVTFPVVSFLEATKPFVKNGMLKGNYRIDVAVKEIQFSDKTTWVAGQDVAISGQKSLTR